MSVEQESHQDGEFIAGSNEYAELAKENGEKVNLNEASSTLLMEVDRGKTSMSELAQHAAAEGFEAKEETHCTVIGFKGGSEIMNALQAMPQAEASQAKLEFQQLIDSTKWEISFKPEFYKIQKDYKYPDREDPSRIIEEHRESYVQLAEVPQLQPFYEKLNQIMGTNLEVPMPHVTLYTKGNQMGIGVNSAEEFAELNPQRIEP